WLTMTSSVPSWGVLTQADVGLGASSTPNFAHLLLAGTGNSGGITGANSVANLYDWQSHEILQLISMSDASHPAVNRLAITNARSGGGPVLLAAGTDASVATGIFAKGATDVYLGYWDGSTVSTAVPALWLSGSPSTVNYLKITAGASGVTPLL